MLCTLSFHCSWATLNFRGPPFHFNQYEGMTSSWKVAQVKSDPHSYVWLSQLWISTIRGSITYFRHPEYKPKPVYHLSWPREGNLMVNFGITATSPPPKESVLAYSTLFCMQTRKSCKSVSQALQLQLAHTTCTKASHASGRAYWFVFIRLKRGVPIPLHVNGSMHWTDPCCWVLLRTSHWWHQS